MYKPHLHPTFLGSFGYMTLGKLPALLILLSNNKGKKNLRRKQI